MLRGWALKNKLDGEETNRRIRDYFLAHMCATQKECSLALGIPKQTVTRHVKIIRAEWRYS